MELLELSKFIKELNDSIYDHLEILPGREFRPFCLETDGEDIIIHFFDQEIYSTMNSSERELNKIKKEIVIEIKEILANFQNIKINTQV